MRRSRRFAAALMLAALGACSAPIDGPRTTNTGGPIVSVPPPISLETVESSIDDGPTQTGVREGTIDPVDAEFCQRMVAYQDSTDFELTSNDPNEPPPNRRSLEAMRAALQAMRPTAAADIQAAIDTYAAAIERLLGLLRAYDYDMDRALQSSEADKIRAVVADPAVIDADRTLNDAAASVCGYVGT